MRELLNCIERAGTLAEGDIIDLKDLRPGVTAVSHKRQPNPLGRTLLEMEQSCILDALRQTRGNKSAAASRLGLASGGCTTS